MKIEFKFDSGFCRQRNRWNFPITWQYIKLCIKHWAFPLPRKFIDDWNQNPLHDKTICMKEHIYSFADKEKRIMKELPLLYKQIAPPTYTDVYWDTKLQQFITITKK